MCGIVGSIGLRKPRDYIGNGLKMLDYRGYDSAGVAYFDNGFKVYKDVGSVEHLLGIVPKSITTNIMIGHTRWATHGAPNKNNTHPHVSFHNTVCLVHNGVIENFKEIKQFLLEKNYEFYGETDSEIVANLIEYYYLQINDVDETIKKVISELKGSYAICLFFNNNKDRLYVFKNGSPLVIGLGNGFNLVASDASPMTDYTNDFDIILFYPLLLYFWHLNSIHH